MANTDYYNAEGKPALREITDEAGKVTGREYFNTEAEEPFLLLKKETYSEIGTVSGLELHRPDGTLKEVTSYNSEGKINSRKLYNAEGVLERMQEPGAYYGDGYYVDSRALLEHIFDTDGREIALLTTFPDGGFTRDEFDADGRVSKRIMHDEINPAGDTEIRYMYDSGGARVSGEVFDASGCRREKELYNSDGDVVVRERYDADGKPVSREMYDPEEKTGTGRTYDSAGRTVEKDIYIMVDTDEYDRDDSPWRRKEKISYNAETGAVVFSETYRSIFGDDFEDPGTRVITTRTEYGPDGGITAMIKTDGEIDEITRYGMENGEKTVTVTVVDRPANTCTVYSEDLLGNRTEIEKHAVKDDEKDRREEPCDADGDDAADTEEAKADKTGEDEEDFGWDETDETEDRW